MIQPKAAYVGVIFSAAKLVSMLRHIQDTSAEGTDLKRMADEWLLKLPCHLSAGSDQLVDEIQAFVIDESSQAELWEEVSQNAREIAWGTDYWDFAKDAQDEFILVRKSKQL